MDLYREWTLAWNKDDLNFYENHEFRSIYTTLHMHRKACMFEQRVSDEVNDTLRSIWTQTNRTWIQVLSLGCGPGSDLLGLLRAVNSALKSGDEKIAWRYKELTCYCTGVDVFNWSHEDFTQQIDDLDRTGALGPIRTEFVVDDMENFVLRRFPVHCPANGFDFICLSFADAGRNLELIGSLLPGLLSTHGRVMVLDNNISPVLRLTEHEYRCTHAGYGISVHIRGPSDQRTLGSYRRMQESPIQAYRQQKAAAEARRQEEQRLQQERQISYQQDVCQFRARQKSWCKCCSIL